MVGRFVPSAQVPLVWPDWGPTRRFFYGCCISQQPRLSHCRSDCACACRLVVQVALLQTVVLAWWTEASAAADGGGTHARQNEGCLESGRTGYREDLAVSWRCPWPCYFWTVPPPLKCWSRTVEEMTLHWITLLNWLFKLRGVDLVSWLVSR